MKMNDVVSQLCSKNGALSSLGEKKARAVVREVFAYIGEAIDTTEEGVVTLPGVGRFRIKMVEKEVEGNKTITKRILFKRAEKKNNEKQDK